MSGITGGERLNAPPAEDTVKDQRASRDISARRDFKTPNCSRPAGAFAARGRSPRLSDCLLPYRDRRHDLVSRMQSSRR
jgi:hypothetical protein